MPTTIFWIARSLRVPGLGVLVVPVPPAPDWLGASPLHTALHLRLLRPGHPPLALPATIEELTLENQLPTRALLLDADPPGDVPPGAELELLAVAPAELL